MMICPKCGENHKRSDECVKCNIIFEKYLNIDALKKEVRTGHEIVTISRTFTKIVLYPVIALLAVFLLWQGYPERAVMLRPLSIYLFFGIPAMFFGIAGIKNLIKGFILHRNMQDNRWALPLTAGFLLNGAMIVIILCVSVGDYNHRQNKKRYNMAVDHIQQMHYFIIDYLSDPSNSLPPENEDLKVLRFLAPDHFPKEASLVDPWGEPYRYRVEENSIYIWSFGPDGLNDTGDDIDTNSRRYRWQYWHWPAA
jgi:hypothetical protein